MAIKITKAEKHLDLARGPQPAFTWECPGCGREHYTTPEFLAEDLPDDVHFGCSFCGADGPDIDTLRSK